VCGGDSYVIDSRDTGYSSAIRRRRRCLRCDQRWTTWETILSPKRMIDIEAATMTLREKFK
jgi:transcriptional regulator NrdR family protein